MKKAFLFIALLITEMTLHNGYAQTGWNKYWLSGGMLYDWQFDKGGIGDFKKATSIGFRLSVNGEMGHMWAYRLHLTVSGFLSGEGYDRRGVGGADFMLLLNSAISGDRVNGNIYFLAGSGFAYGVENTDAVALGVDAGIGYSYWFNKHNGVFGEMDFSFYSTSSSLSGTLSLGYQRRL